MSRIGVAESQDPGSLEVTPEVVVEGQPVNVKYDGSGTVWVQIDGGPWEEVPVDPTTGEGEFTAPLGAGIMIFSDRMDSPSEAIVEIVSASPP